MSTLLRTQAALQKQVQTITFDPTALEALILEDLGLSSANAKVEFLVEDTWLGNGLGEHKVSVFKGVRVTSTRIAASAPFEGGMYGDH